MRWGQLRALASFCSGIGLLVHCSLACAQAKPGAGKSDNSHPESGKPDPKRIEAARLHFRRGLALYEEGALDGALSELQRAHELAPSYRVLYNIATVYRQKNDFANAWRAYHNYLAEGGDAISARRRKKVEGELASLEKKVARLSVTTKPAKGRLTVDGSPAGTLPLSAPLMLNVGRHRLRFRAENGAIARKEVSLVGGERRSLVLEARSPETKPPPPPPPKPKPPAPKPAPVKAEPPPPEPAQADTRPLWIGWTVSGLLAGSAVATGVLAMAAADDLRAERERPNTNRAALDSAQKRARNFALATDILGGLALATAGVTLYLSFDGEGPTVRAEAKGMALKVTPQWVSLGGQF